MKIATIATSVLFLGLRCFGQDTVLLDASGAVGNDDGITVAVPELSPNQILSGERDGRWFTSVRLSSPNAAGMQLLIADLTLPQGAKLYLIEPGVQGETIRGIYEGSGPLDGSAFWSDAVAGSEAILRVEYAEQVAGGVPLRLIGARHLTEIGVTALSRSVPTERLAMESGSGNAAFRGQVVPFRVQGGMAVTEGDILLGGIDEVELANGKGSSRQSMGLTSTSSRWPGGVVPYVIDSALPNQARITDAVAHWNTELSGVIQLVPRTTQASYVKFTYSANTGLCNSYVGMINMAGQPINLGDYCSKGNVIHEIGHTVGLFHEHMREDRNTRVIINFANIDPNLASNFSQAISTSDDLGTYDYASIMHYPAYAFSINGLPTIETIPAGIAIGQRTALSAGDIAGVRQMYSSVTTAPSTVQVTIASNPSGRSLVVDGATVTAPALFTWTPGGVHSVSASNQSGTDVKYTFTSWSDAGAQSHNYAAPGSNATLTATFASAFRITGASSNATLGAVSVLPASVDSYYAKGTSVQIGATSNAGSCLSSWSGVSAPPTSSLQLSATQPYSVLGNFQTGSVTLGSSSVTSAWKGGNASVSITSSSGCAWSATTATSWIKITTGVGTGSGTLRISIAQNNTKSPRTGAVQVGSATLQVTQTPK